MTEQLRIFVAGATGVVGRALVPMLVGAGHVVMGTTRTANKTQSLEAMGATPALLDAYDSAAMMRAVTAFRPGIIIHQLTDLPAAPGTPGYADSIAANGRLRVAGTRNLMDAAAEAGATRVIAQSIAFAYAPGREPHAETDPLDSEGARAATVRAVRSLEDAVTGTPGIDGIVLRYGFLYGPGTWNEDGPVAPPSVHIDAAAHAAMLALTRGAAGPYNISDDDGVAAIAKARRELGFDPGFRV